jgi:biotin carboxyl carrier protein
VKKLTATATVVKAALYVLLATACARTEAVENIPAGTEVTVVTQDGTLVRGKIAKVDAELVTLTGERPNTSTEITRTAIKEVKRVSSDDREPAAAAPSATAAASKPAAPIVRTFTIPDNTVLDVTLGTALASDTSRVEQPVRGTVASPVVIDGTTVVPAGASLQGHVTHVDDSDKIKGRAELSFRFTRLTTGSVTYDIDTTPLAFVAEGTKKDDAVKIGAGAAAGAVIGAIAGGKKGAAIGTAVGAGAGTGVVLATDGKEIRLAEGRKLKVSLSNPLTIRTK